MKTKILGKAMEFIRSIFRGGIEGKIEFRLLPSKRQIFMEPRTRDLPSFPDGENVYFGVGTRDGKGGRKENLVAIPALWVDLDFKDASEEKILSKLKTFPLKPSAIVRTGGGFHAYWLLRTPCPLSAIPVVEDYLRRIAAYLGGDMQSAEASRVLRMPGSLNLKYDPPRRVFLRSFFPSRRYDLTHFC